MSGPQEIQGFGLDELAASVMIELIDKLNGELDQVATEKVALDQRIAAARGHTYVPVTLEHVDVDNYCLGNDPSLLDDGSGRVPTSRYPNVCVMAYEAGAAPDGGGDHLQHYLDRVYVETMVKASPSEGAEVCDLRAWRHADAINRVIQKDRSIGGKAFELQLDPSLIVSEVFTRPERADEGHGADWFWQAARIEYEIDHFAAYES